MTAKNKELPGRLRRLRRLRRKRGLSQYDIAAALDRHQPWVSLMERGYVQPRPKDIEKLAQLLRVKPSGLGFGVGKSKR